MADVQVFLKAIGIILYTMIVLLPAALKVRFFMMLIYGENDMKNYERNRRSLDVFAKQKRGMTSNIGRSMVEMLGVLAIIGVLSAGGLAGYNKAMTQHKLNKNAEEIGYLLSVAIYNNDKLKDASGNLLPELQALGALKENIQIDEDGVHFRDTLQNVSWFEHISSGGTAYCVQLPQSDFSVKVCQNYINVFKSFADDLDAVEVMNAAGQNRIRNTWTNKKYGSSKNLDAITNADIINLCQSFCGGSEVCILYAFWDWPKESIASKIENDSVPYQM